MAMNTDGLILAIIIGTLAAIGYSLRILVLLERRIARMDENIQRITLKIAKEELRIEAEEHRIERMLEPKKKRSKEPEAAVES